MVVVAVMIMCWSWPHQLAFLHSGIFSLGEKLGIDATEDIRILVLLWKMGCNDKPSEINKNEWMQGCATLSVDSWDKMKKLIPSLDTGFLDNNEFKDFYKFW